MQPESPQTPQPQLQPSPTQQPTPAKKSIRLPLFLMLWPIGLLILALLAYTLLNLFMPDPIPAEGDLFAANPSPVKVALNTVTFLIGAGSVVFGPISFIVGIVLLIQRRSR